MFIAAIAALALNASNPIPNATDQQKTEMMHDDAVRAAQNAKTNQDRDADMSKAMTEDQMNQSAVDAATKDARKQAARNKTNAQPCAVTESACESQCEGMTGKEQLSCKWDCKKDAIACKDPAGSSAGNPDAPNTVKARTGHKRTRPMNTGTTHDTTTSTTPDTTTP